MQRTEALVVGAGPTGTVAAYRLAQMGIDVTLCEAAASCAHDLRASTIHAPTLEMLDELGVAGELIERGLKAPVYHLRERRTGRVIAFDMSELADRTRFPYRLQCEQYYLAMALAKRLQEHPRARVLFSTRAIGVTQNGVEAIATVERDSKREEIAADFIIGADGAHSVVRKSLDVTFDGFTYEEKFVSLSTAFPIEEVIPDIAYVNYISDPEEWLCGAYSSRRRAPPAMRSSFRTRTLRPSSAASSATVRSRRPTEPSIAFTRESPPPSSGAASRS